MEKSINRLCVHIDATGLRRANNKGDLFVDRSKDKTDVDELLVKKAQKGDMEAFEALIGKYEKKIYNISCRMLLDSDEAYDAAQDVFLKVFKSIKSFKSESKFSTWLYRVTSNVCFDILRKRKDKMNSSLDAEIEINDSEVKIDPVALTPGVEDEVEREELIRLVSESVNELPEKHRVMIILRDFQDMSYSDIATSLDCPEGTIKSRINRARRALKNLLEGKKELTGYISVI